MRSIGMVRLTIANAFAIRSRSFRLRERLMSSGWSDFRTEGGSIGHGVGFSQRVGKAVCAGMSEMDVCGCGENV